MHIKKIFLLILLNLIIFFWSYLLLFYYTEGDQIGYKLFYEFQKEINFFETFINREIYISSSEPLYNLLIWAGSNLEIKKNIYISAFNLLLSIGLILFLKKEKAPLYIYFFIFFNYYLIVLFTAAERLKFAYIFIIYAIIFNQRLKTFFIFAAFLSHFQSLLIYISFLPTFFLNLIKNKKIKLLPILIVLIFIKLYFVFLLLELNFFKKLLLAALTKYEGYKFHYKFDFDYKILILSSIFLMITKTPLKLFLSYFILILFSYIIGDSRINILIFTIGMYFIITQKLCNHPFIIILMIYYVIQALFFIYNIFKYNTGYP